MTVFHQDHFVISSGQFIVQWPDRMTPEDYADIQEYVDMLLRKLERIAVVQTPCSPE